VVLTSHRSRTQYQSGFDPTKHIEPFFAGMHTVSGRRNRHANLAAGTHPRTSRPPRLGETPGLVLHREEGGTGIPKLRRACSRLALRGICSCCVRTRFTACPLLTAMPGRQATVRIESASRGGGRGDSCVVSSV
jgi:hypothetical protein